MRRKTKDFFKLKILRLNNKNYYKVLPFLGRFKNRLIELS